MRQRSGQLRWRGILILLGGLLVMITACGGDEAPVPAEPTQELAVVVFSTEEPTPTPSEPTSSPTPAPTVGFGAQGDDASGAVGVQAAANPAPDNSPINRPADVNPLTGLKVDDPAVLRRRPLMVRIGNDPGARPQVALNEADIVYEEIVEWWVTRFTAIYLSQDPETIAPIRSARLINLDLGSQYQGALANSGGSDGVRWEISQSDIVNLDEFFVPRPFFYRPNQDWQTRLAFDATAARDYLQSEDLEGDVKLRGFEFSQSPDFSTFPVEAVGDATEVSIPYPRQTSATGWEYDANQGAYLRFINGGPMLTFGGDQVAAANVIIYFAEHLPTDIVEDSNGATSIRIIANGLGTAWLLRDGKILKGNWETDGRDTPNFIFNDGRAMPLKPGNTWVQVVPPDAEIEIDGVTHTRLDTANPTANEADDEVEPTAVPMATSTPIGSRSVRQPTATPTP
jgi:hypothetical protein